MNVLISLVFLLAALGDYFYQHDFKSAIFFILVAIFFKPAVTIEH